MEPAISRQEISSNKTSNKVKNLRANQKESSQMTETLNEKILQEQKTKAFWAYQARRDGTWANAKVRSVLP